MIDRDGGNANHACNARDETEDESDDKTVGHTRGDESG